MPWRHPPEVVGEAFELLDDGWTPTQVSRILAKRGTPVSASTIHRWKNPALAERGRVANRERSRRQRAEARERRPPDPYAGLTGLSRKVAMLEDRVARLEQGNYRREALERAA